MEEFLIQGWDPILPGWRWLMLVLWLLEKDSTLWYGMSQWVEMESASNIPFL